MRLVTIAAVIACASLLAGCGGSNSSPTPTAPTPAPPPSGGTSSAVTVTLPRGATSQTTGAYVPNPVTVSVGGTVTWVNSDVDVHDVTSNSRLWASGNLAPGARFSFTFQSAGSFSYLCTLHPNMVGTVVVQ